MAPNSTSSPNSPVDFSDDGEDGMEAPSAILSTSASATRSCQLRKMETDETDSQLQTSSFLKDIQQERKQIHEDRESRKDERAETTNALLRQIINKLSTLFLFC